MKKAIFLDRDGTLIVDKIYLNDPEEIQYLPGVFVALERLQNAGYYLVIVTNQSGVPRGLVMLENLERIHQRIGQEFRLRGINLLDFYFAPYLPSSDHTDRKPNPGMILRAAKDHEIELAQSWIVGDRWSDIQAGHNAGTRAVLVEGTEPKPYNLLMGPHGANAVASDILEASKIIV